MAEEKKPKPMTLGDAVAQVCTHNICIDLQAYNAHECDTEPTNRSLKAIVY